MRLLNLGFAGLLAAIGLFCSGCHAMNWHAMCLHGITTNDYFATPAASSSSSSSRSGGHWHRNRRSHSDNGRHLGQNKVDGKPVP